MTLTGNRPHRGAVALVCVAQVVVVLDVTIVTSALPAVGAALHASAAQLAWVSSAYTLTFGGLLVGGGRVADLAGRRRAFVGGLLLFSIASALCALAWSPTALVAARVLQGVGAALLSPAALALLTALTTAGEQRRRAVGWWTAAAAGGGASGWALGGLLVEYAGWRWIFAVNVPLGLLAVLLARRTLPLSPAEHRPRRLDLPGAVLLTLGLGCLVGGLGAVGEGAGREPVTWAVLAGAALLLALTRRHERRTTEPLLPRGVLGRRTGVAANLTAAALTGSTSPAMFLATLWAQQVVGVSPLRVAALFPVLNLTVVAGSLAGPRLLRRLGVRTTLQAGFAGVLTGCLMLLTLPAGGLPTTRLLAAFALMGAGLGVASVASTTAGADAAPAEHRGVASGVLTSSAQVGTALGVALLVPLTSMGTTGYRWGWAGALLVALLGATASLLVGGDLRRPPRGTARGRRWAPGPRAGRARTGSAPAARADRDAS